MIAKYSIVLLEKSLFLRQWPCERNRKSRCCATPRQAEESISQRAAVWNVTFNRRSVQDWAVRFWLYPERKNKLQGITI
jgi:hypothetical protein